MKFPILYNPPTEIVRINQVQPFLVKKKAISDANPSIVCGTMPGRYSVEATGTVFTRNVPDYAQVFENRAKQIG